MKTLISYFLAILLTVSITPLEVFAGETERIEFEDGSYFTIQIEESGARASGTKTGTKTYTYNSSSGTALWKATVRGTYTYNGSSATCTASSCDVTIYNSDWYVVSKSASKNGNSATASVTMGQKILGITASKKTASIKLTCDANGNLS